jgi:hypothetical protein
VTQIHPEHSPDASVHGNHAPVQTTRIEISERTLTILALAFGCIAIMGGFWSISEAQKAERESRMLQYYVLEMDAKLIAAGIKKPDESVAQQQEKRK